MVMNKVCVDCGVSPEDTPEKCLTVIIDERRLECCICESCKNKRSNKPYLYKWALTINNIWMKN